MLKLIVGVKGSGKTSRLVDELNTHARDAERNVICIERDNRLDLLVKHHIRLIDISEYPVNSLDQLLSFIAGMNARDYDITHIFIDSICKVAGVKITEVNLTEFVEKLAALSDQTNTTIYGIVTTDITTLDPSLKKYVVE